MFSNLIFLDKDATLFLAQRTHHDDISSFFVRSYCETTGFDFEILEHKRPLYRTEGNIVKGERSDILFKYFVIANPHYMHWILSHRLRLVPR